MGELLVGVEGGGVGRDGERVGAVDESGAHGYGGAVADAQVQELGRGQDAVLGGRVRHRITDDFADLDAADLVEEEHCGFLRAKGALAVLLELMVYCSCSAAL